MLNDAIKGRAQPLLMLLAPLLLVACSKPVEPAAVAADPVMPAQCMKDTDCKGERICDAGKCAAAPPVASTAAVSGTPSVAAMPDAVPQAAVSKAKWKEGFGQGNVEYFVEDQGIRVYVSCPTQDGSADAASGLMLYRLSDQTEVPSFQITVGGKVFDGPFEADNRAGESNFLQFLEAARAGDMTVSYAGKQVVFGRNNAATVLPKFPSKDFVCNLM